MQQLLLLHECVLGGLTKSCRTPLFMCMIYIEMTLIDSELMVWKEECSKSGGKCQLVQAEYASSRNYAKLAGNFEIFLNIRIAFGRFMVDSFRTLHCMNKAVPSLEEVREGQ